jgi:hypothetical protein
MQRELRAFNPRLNAMLATVIDRQAPRAESWMKVNAPWTDRTSSARNTLRAIPEHDGNQHGLILTGGVPYQIYLETRWAGRYAILQPAMVHWGAVIMSNMNGLLDRLGRR